MDTNDISHRTLEDLRRAVTYAHGLLANARAAILGGPAAATEGEMALLQLNEQLVDVVGSLAEIIAGPAATRDRHQFAISDHATEAEAHAEQEMPPPDQRSPFQLRRERHETLARRGDRYSQEHAHDHARSQEVPRTDDDSDGAAGWCPGCQTSRTHRECRPVVRGQTSVYVCSVCGATIEEGPAF